MLLYILPPFFYNGKDSVSLVFPIVSIFRVLLGKRSWAGCLWTIPPYGRRSRALGLRENQRSLSLTRRHQLDCRNVSRSQYNYSATMNWTRCSVAGLNPRSSRCYRGQQEYKSQPRGWIHLSLSLVSIIFTNFKGLDSH